MAAEAFTHGIIDEENLKRLLIKMLRYERCTKCLHYVN